MASLFLSQPDGSELEIPLTQEVIRVGRSGDNDVPVPDDSVSTFHAELHWDGARFHLKDLGSTNGVRVNGERVGEAALSDGDLLRFGNVRARYSSPVESNQAAAPAAAATGTTYTAPAESAPAPAHAPRGGVVLPSAFEPSPLAPEGFGPKTAPKNPEKMIYMAVAALVILASFVAVGLSFTMK